MTWMSDANGRIFSVVIAGVDERHLGKGPLVLVDRIGADRRGGLGDEITPFAVRMDGEMARAGAGLGGDVGGSLGVSMPVPHRT